MGVNRVDLANGENLINLQNDTVTPETLAKGATAHNKEGDLIVGTMTSEGGSGGDNITVDWETQVINKPFYDNRVIVNYSYDENPNPISFDCVAIGYSFYKISDLVLTKEELFNSQFIINGRERDKYTQDNVLVETDELLIVQFPDNGFAFCVCNTVGTCPFSFMGYSLSVNVPEVGIYRAFYLGGGMSDIDTIEIIVGDELKKLDEKFIPEIDSLPKVTTADNGKFLSVENGQWVAKTMSEWSGGTY